MKSLKLLFCMENLYPLIGGAERSIDSLIQALKAYPEVETDYLCHQRLIDENLNAEALVAKSDIVITQGRWANMAIQGAKEFGKKSALFVRSYESLCGQVQDAHFISHCGQRCSTCEFRQELDAAPSLLIANSQYTASFLEREHGLKSEVIYPFIDPTLVTAPRRSRHLIVMNQLAYHKGADIFIEVARRMPEYSFLIVGYHCWDPEVEIPANLFATGLTNPLEFYGDTLLFLAPARWNETFGRMIIESAYNGIPAIASSRGAPKEDELLPPSLLVEDIEDIDAWVSRIKQVLGDYDKFVQLLASKSLERFSIERQVDKFYRCMRNLCGLDEHASR